MSSKTARELAEELIRELNQLKDDYQEILKLHEMLEEAEIPHAMLRKLDGWQIGYPALEPITGRVCSVIEHRYSYGAREDLLEIMGLLTAEEEQWDSVCGYLTAENVFARIRAHWEERR